jgi:transmembrane sensor
MMDTRQPLGRHVTPTLDEARLARQRDAIAARIEARKRSRWLLLLAPVVCAAAVALLVVSFRGNRESTVMAGTIVQAPSGEPLSMTLLDGSRVVLDPEAQLSLMTLLPKDVRLELNRGGIDLDVTHHEDRTFVVAAGGYEVRVLGTRFAVRLLPAEERPVLEVKVFRGRVRVTRIGEPTDLRVLGAGETWSTALGPTSKVDEPPSASPTIATDPTPSALPSASVAALPSPRIGAKELWSQAEAARASKRFQDEALALNTLRLRHRSDPRAGLAAFELGRLRQDTLHDPAGAAEAFADAIVLAPSGPFREDAEARRIEALDTAGRRDQCAEAKAAFMARYPAGIHRQRVSVMCEHR